MVIILIIFYFLFSSLQGNWNEIKAVKIKFNYLYLAAAFILLMFRHFLMPLIWQKILNNLLVDIKFIDSFRIWYLALGGRYLPGRIWYAVGMIYLSSEIGIPKNKVLVGGAFNITLSLISAAVVGIIALPAYLPWEISRLTLVAMGIPFCYILLMMANKMVHIISQKKGFQHEVPEVKFADWASPFILYIVSWVLYGMGLYLLLLSITTVEPGWIIHIISSYAISHIIGFLSIITPAGLAVREGVLTLLLSSLFPSYIASFTAVICRILFTLAELASFCMALIFKKLS